MFRRNFVFGTTILPFLGGTAYAKKHTSNIVKSIPYSEILVNMNDGKVIYNNDDDILIQPASLTKMMTLFILFDELDKKNISITDNFIMTPDASKKPPTKLGILPGNQISVVDSICAMTVHSCNDITAMVAEQIGGTENKFVNKMNEHARNLGLKKTRFTNSTGLPESINVSTAYDMALLGATLMARHHEYMKAFAIPYWSWNGKLYRNSNHLMGEYEGMDFCKTGYISESGFNLIASAQKEHHRYLGVIIGAPNQNFRNQRMKKMLDWAFATKA